MLPALVCAPMNGDRTALAALAAAILLSAAPTLAAQSEPVAIKPPYVRPVIDSTVPDTAVAEAPAPPPPNCWRAQPMPPCPGFFLTEFGVEAPIISRGRAADPAAPRSDIRMRLLWSFGVMGTKERNSHGALLSITSDELVEPLSFMLEYRYRRWLAPTHAIDIGGGYRSMSMWRDQWGFDRGRGITAHAGYTYNPWIGVVLRGDLVRGAGRRASALHVGVRSTRLSELAIRATAILAGRALLAAMGIETDDEDDES